MRIHKAMGHARWLMIAAAALVAVPIAAPAVAQTTEDSQVEGVTAAAWAIADAKTGKVLASHNLDQQLNSASITKTMTALIISEMAEKDPSVLKEELTFTEHAVGVAGSKTGLAAGERISAGEALYGLMLPSGNDAGIMFADHFGPRLAGVGKASNRLAAYRQFVAAMNRKAKSLGMTETHYSSSFGDSLNPDKKTTSARDLLILARAAMANPLVRKVVGTLDHTTTAKTETGERTVIWHNVNRLLGRPGVTGIKTGTNRSAHACLLLEVNVKGRDYVISILGSRNDGARYNDALKVLASVTGSTLK